MSLEEQRRAGFEEAFPVPDGVEWRGADYFPVNVDDTPVYIALMRQACMASKLFEAWNKALDSVEIDLSKHHGGQAIPGSERMFLSDARAAIEAAGLRIKP